MAVKTKEEILSAIRARIGEDDSDEAISLLEDVADTLDYKVGNGEDWKKRYEENDKAWRTKYKERFMSSGKEKETEDEIEEEKDDGKNLTYEELFTTKEGK